ncbi:5-hydroxytryptamine receptor 6-like [Penaeus chinensis]|uniref:5-hydroxytryptamine receptor 6-like n=1 Tax=Penaeus chinensis TaxID=139456 RepID=UPI001FB5E0C9|nr:5-hydroxytryptamine receptor 6-like [Penaeus chinensis]
MVTAWHPDGHEVGHVASLVAMSLLTALSLLANLLVTAAVLGSPQLRTTWNNCFVLNLCLTEAAAAVVVLPLSVTAFVSEPEELDPGLCVFAHFFHSCLVNVITWTLCLISVDRHYLILMPMTHAAEVTLFRTLVAILVVWAVSVLPAGYLIVTAEPWRGGTVCCAWGLGVSSSNTGYVLTVALLEFLIPALTMLSMYASIFRVARRAVRRVVPVTTQVRTISERVTSKEEPLVARSIFSLLPAVQGRAFPLGKDVVGKTTANDRAAEQSRGGVFGLVSPFLGHEAEEAASVLTPIDGFLDSVTWVAGTPTPTSPSTSATLMLTASASFGKSYPKAKLGKMASNSGPRGASGQGKAKKAARTLLLVVGTFWILCGPYYVFNTYVALAHLAPDAYSEAMEEGLKLLKVALEERRSVEVTLKQLEQTLNYTLHNASLPCRISSQVGGEKAQVLETLAHLTEWLLYGSLLVNPFLYGLLNRAIRTQLFRLMDGAWNACWGCGRDNKIAPSDAFVSEDASEAEGVEDDLPGHDQESLEDILEFLQRTADKGQIAKDKVRMLLNLSTNLKYSLI